MNNLSFEVLKANDCHIQFAPQISHEMEMSARQRGTGISKRTPAQIIQKMMDGKAIIALTHTGEWAGFCYIESWQNDEYVSNSGLIVANPFREKGLARTIKQEIFKLSKVKFPNAKIFGLTTSSAVMKINSEMGYEPVVYAEITTDENFWTGCKSCVNYEILQSKGKKNCLCTAMLFNPLVKTKELTFSHSMVETA
ncbi:MAG: GNAT family N-acetyltransferase [Bacteroidota bacterium]